MLITGNLDLTSISTNGFTLALTTLDAAGGVGMANLTIGTPYTFTILQTTGTITGFNPGNFVIDTTNFELGQMPLSVFSLTADSSHLYLNFTTIPEPSTWALLTSGVSLSASPVFGAAGSGPLAQYLNCKAGSAIPPYN